MDSGVILGVVLAAGTVVVWAVRIEGKVNSFDGFRQEVREDIQYIRERIDSALNGHGK